MVKIGNTSFREETIKKMTFKEFDKTYREILKGQDLKSVYETVTGSKAKEAKAEKTAAEDFENDNLG